MDKVVTVMGFLCAASLTWAESLDDFGRAGSTVCFHGWTGSDSGGSCSWDASLCDWEHVMGDDLTWGRTGRGRVVLTPGMLTGSEKGRLLSPLMCEKAGQQVCLQVKFRFSNGGGSRLYLQKCDSISCTILLRHDYDDKTNWMVDSAKFVATGESYRIVIVGEKFEDTFWYESQIFLDYVRYNDDSCGDEATGPFSPMTSSTTDMSSTSESPSATDATTGTLTTEATTGTLTSTLTSTSTSTFTSTSSSTSTSTLTSTLASTLASTSLFTSSFSTSESQGTTGTSSTPGITLPRDGQSDAGELAEKGRSSSSDDGRRDGNKSDEEEEEQGSLTAIIISVSCALLLVVLITIIIAFIVVRRRRRKTTTKPIELGAMYQRNDSVVMVTNELYACLGQQSPSITGTLDWHPQDATTGRERQSSSVTSPKGTSPTSDVPSLPRVPTDYDNIEAQAAALPETSSPPSKSSPEKNGEAIYDIADDEQGIYENTEQSAGDQEAEGMYENSAVGEAEPAAKETEANEYSHLMDADKRPDRRHDSYDRLK